MAELNTVMGNVMAALHTFGIEYDTNCYGFDVRGEIEDPEKSIEYKGYGDNSKFKKEFEKFLSNPKYYEGIYGKRWMDAEKYVIIQLGRTYKMSEADYDNYAAACGCETFEEAQCLYGDPMYTPLLINVKVRKGEIDHFVRRIAKYCW